MLTTRFSYSRAHRRTGFTLVEILVVMTIILVMVGLGVTAFKGGAASDATKGASVVAASEFDVARNEAIMRQTVSRVVIDTAWVAGRTDQAAHYLRRMAVAYLNPQGTDATGNPAATSGQSVDPSKASNWVQSGAWIVLPGNVYFDINYSVLHGTSMSVNFGGAAAPTSGYCYYQFSPNGQTQSAPLAVFAPSTLSASNGSVSSTPAQCVLSTGSVDPTTGTFQERGIKSSSVQAAAPTSCYGFVVYRMGHMSFFRDNSEIQQPS